MGSFPETYNDPYRVKIFIYARACVNKMTYADGRWGLSILKGKSTLLQISFTWTKLYISVFSSYFRKLMARRQLQSIQFQAPCKRTQHCGMLHVASVCTPCCMLLDVVAYCCAKFEIGQTFQPLPTRAQQLSTLLPQQCWELLRPFARSLSVSVNEEESKLFIQPFNTV